MFLQLHYKAACMKMFQYTIPVSDFDVVLHFVYFDYITAVINSDLNH